MRSSCNAFRKFHRRKTELNAGNTGDSAIPKGLCPPAQGCEERATLGEWPAGCFNPNGVVSRFNRGAATPLGLFPFAAMSQGSSFLATLRFMAESLWDSPLGFPQGFGAS